MQEVTLKLPEAVVAAIREIAGKEDVSPGQVIRAAIERDLYRRSRARKADRPDERLVAPLRALLADDFAYAKGWDDLQRRLRAKGVELREAGGGLALHAFPEGRRLCKGSDLGHGYAALMRKFRAGFPGHAHAYMARRIA